MSIHQPTKHDSQQWDLFAKPVTDRTRRMMDLAMAMASLPVATAATTAAAATTLLKKNLPNLKRDVSMGRYGRSFDRYSLERDTGPSLGTGWTRFLDLVHAHDAPQILNIIRGDMAFVGPEALSPQEADKLESHECSRFAVRPGIIDNVRFKKKLDIDAGNPLADERAYLAERSVVADLKLLIKSMPTLFLGSPGLVSADRVNLLGVDIANLSNTKAVEQILAACRKRDRAVAFVDSHCFNRSHEDAIYKKALEDSELVLPDGVAVALAASLIGAELKGSFDSAFILRRLCLRAAEEGLRVVLLSDKQDSVEHAREKMLESFDGLKIDGAFGFSHEVGIENDQNLVEQINLLKPDLLLVAGDSSGQDTWISRNMDGLDVGVAIGVRDFLEIYSGRVPEIPVWARELGLAWLWRFARQPRLTYHRTVVDNASFIYRAWSWYASQTRNVIVDRFEGFAHPGRKLRVEAKLQLRRAMWWVARDGMLRVKRGVDIVGSAAGMALLSPVYLAVIAAIKIEDGGSIVYTSQRVGRFGREFDFYKFRSMVEDAEKLKAALLNQNESDAGVIFKMKDDPRITKVGKFIRRASIDELPQLYNVLKGDMSLVGPRPPLPKEVAEYKVGDRYRLEVTPGLTCIWQVSGRSNLDFHQQVALDREYIHDQTLMNDLKLIFQTVPAVLSGQGSY